MDDPNRCFGKEEGLGKRLAMWANSLGRNKMYPWLGLGIVDDLKAAARKLGTDPDKLYPTDIFDHRAEKPASVKLEYDL